MNLFLTEDGVLKLGYYGLFTQAECYDIKGTNCDGIRSFAPEVFKGEYEMKSDVWSFGIALLEMLGITPFVKYGANCLPIMEGAFSFPVHSRVHDSEELTDFVDECFIDLMHERGDTVVLNQEIRWSVKRLLNVGVMG